MNRPLANHEFVSEDGFKYGPHVCRQSSVRVSSHQSIIISRLTSIHAPVHKRRDHDVANPTQFGLHIFVGDSKSFAPHPHLKIGGMIGKGYLSPVGVKSDEGRPQVFRAKGTGVKAIVSETGPWTRSPGSSPRTRRSPRQKRATTAWDGARPKTGA